PLQRRNANRSGVAVPPPLRHRIDSMSAVTPQSAASSSHDGKSTRGRFGRFGGRYVPETLMAALDELEAAYDRARADASFQEELDALLRHFVGRPTALTEAHRLAAFAGGARILLKREDLAHT